MRMVTSAPTENTAYMLLLFTDMGQQWSQCEWLLQRLRRTQLTCCCCLQIWVNSGHNANGYFSAYGEHSLHVVVVYRSGLIVVTMRMVTSAPTENTAYMLLLFTDLGQQWSQCEWLLQRLRRTQLTCCCCLQIWVNSGHNANGYFSAYGEHSLHVVVVYRSGSTVVTMRMVTSAPTENTAYMLLLFTDLGQQRSQCEWLLQRLRRADPTS